MTVLLIEDDTTASKLAKEALEEIGHEVVQRHSGSMYLFDMIPREMKIDEVDFVLTDLFLPQVSEADGSSSPDLAAYEPDWTWGVQAALRAQGRGIPFAVLTAGYHHDRDGTNRAGSILRAAGIEMIDHAEKRQPGYWSRVASWLTLYEIGALDPEAGKIADPASGWARASAQGQLDEIAGGSFQVRWLEQLPQGNRPHGSEATGLATAAGMVRRLRDDQDPEGEHTTGAYAWPCSPSESWYTGEIEPA